MTATEIRTAVQTAVEAHVSYNNFYPDWLVVKDRPTEPDYPAVFWKQTTGRVINDNNGIRRTQFVQLMLLTSVATDRTPEELQLAVEAAYEAAIDIIMRLVTVLGHEVISDVLITTMHDEYTQLLSGVVLGFKVDGGYVCYESSRFTD